MTAHVLTQLPPRASDLCHPSSPENPSLCRRSFSGKASLNPPAPPVPPDPPPKVRVNVQSLVCLRLHSRLDLTPTSAATVDLHRHTPLDQIIIPDPCKLVMFKSTLTQNTQSPYISVTAAAALPGCQGSRPPERASHHGNRDLSLSSGGPNHRRFVRLYHDATETSSSSPSSSRRHSAPVHCTIVNGVKIQAMETAAKPSQGTMLQFGTSFNLMGFTQLGLRFSKFLKPINNVLTIKPISQQELATILTQGPTMHQPTFCASPDEALAFKAALKAASLFEVQHLTVYSDPQSLVSLLNSKVTSTSCQAF